ncbi:MAG: phytanoyl-CoA dioxygenase family protein [Pseudomonadales bacterium]|nr:phytanoyl-CoA dioxygenase family protein [Pseudomonadales bacterium]
MAIPCMAKESDPALMAEALAEAGCLVVTDLFDANEQTRVRDELAPYLETVRVIVDDDPTQFYPGHTRRTSALIARSETVGKLAVAEHSLGLCDHFLTPNGEFGYQLHVSAALEVGPGARRQILHREHDSFTFFEHPRPNLIVASMWAVTDFRADNGATLLVPGSHKWTADRQAKDEEVESAEMPAGSVLYWLGGTLHGAGANTSSDWRYGVILTYSLGWLRQEENQYLDVPAEVASKLPPKLRDLIGYKMYRALGYSMNKTVGMRPD